MSDCNCEKDNDVMKEDNWPMTGDVGDIFLSKDNFPIILEIKKNLKNVTINTEAIFNQKSVEESLKNLEIEDLEEQTLKENILLDEESSSDEEAISTEDDTSTDEESEDEIEVKEGQNGKEIIIKHDPSEKAMIIKEEPIEVENTEYINQSSEPETTKSDLEQYLNKLL